MAVLWLVLLIVFIFCFAALVVGAPYLPTLNTQVNAALDLVDLRKGQTLIELGSGDGRVLIAAAKRGINSVGYEINPILVVVSYLITMRYRKQIKIVWGNYWKKQWPDADGVFVFLISRYMRKLDSYLSDYPHKPIKLVSFAFKIPDKKISRSEDGVYLYQYK
ncbi:MAG: hypothetical protein WDN66_00885 [Candidatus Saccharibacteria bacterium]